MITDLIRFIVPILYRYITSKHLPKPPFSFVRLSRLRITKRLKITRKHGFAEKH